MAQRMRSNREAASAFLLTALVVLGGLTAVLFVAPTLVTVGFFLLVVPGLILLVTPSVFLYLLLFSFAWFGLQRKSALVAAGTGLAVVIAVGWLLPEVLNEAARRELADAFRREVAAPQAPRSWRTVTLQTVGQTGRAECNDLCRLLLFNGEVERVLVLNAPDAEAAGRRTSPPPAAALFRIERAGSCAAEKNKYRSHFVNQWLVREKVGDIDRAVQMWAAAGECLVMEPAGDTATDLTVRMLRQREPSGGLRLLPAQVSANGIELLEGSRVVLRRVNLKASLYGRPLHLEPIQNGLEMRGWKWGRKEFVSGKDVDVEQMLRGEAGFQLDPLLGVSPKQLLAELNSALERRELPADDAAFLLVEDVLKERQEKVTPEDAALLARIIRDSRFTAFGLPGGIDSESPQRHRAGTGRVARSSAGAIAGERVPPLPAVRGTDRGAASWSAAAAGPARGGDACGRGGTCGFAPPNGSVGGKGARGRSGAGGLHEGTVDAEAVAARRV